MLAEDKIADDSPMRRVVAAEICLLTMLLLIGWLSLAFPEFRDYAMILSVPYYFYGIYYIIKKLA